VNLDLSTEHELLRETVRQFALERIAPVAEELDREKRFPYELVAEIAELGLMGMTIPEEYGGGGTDTLSYALAVEELARVDSSVAITVAAHHSLGTLPIWSFGTEEQKRRWAVPILRADKTASLGMSEPGAGSDLAGLRTKAELVGDEFVVNGQKVWTSGAHDADVILAFVRTDPNASRHKGISALLIPTDSPGLVRRPFPSVYDRDELDFNEVFFNDVRVPADNLVGPLNGGWRVANGSLGHERTLMWMAFANRLEQLLEDYRPSDEVNADHYATIVMDYYALRLLGSAALGKAARGEVDVAALSVLKVFGSEAEQSALRHALDAAGADGLRDKMLTAPYNPYAPDLFTASWFARYISSYAGTIAGGTSEIQRNIVAQRVLGLPSR
jgi:alkylation response protein AidB-like acyl-CoA dehydrogenase